MSQADLADAIGVSRFSVIAWEKNKGMDEENVARLAEFFGVPIEWIEEGGTATVDRSGNVRVSLVREPRPEYGDGVKYAFPDDALEYMTPEGRVAYLLKRYGRAVQEGASPEELDAIHRAIIDERERGEE